MSDFAFPIVQERRPQARLCYLKKRRTPLEGGLSIGTGPIGSGTLGGIVQDQNGIRYGVTCAHVVEGGTNVEQPAQEDDSTGARQIGTVGAAVTLQKSQAASPCNPYDNASVMNEMDVALINLSDPNAADLKVASLGTLSRVLPKSDLRSGNSIYFTGKESGLPARRLIIGGLNATFRFHLDKNDYLCIPYTFNVRWPNTSPLKGTPAVEEGDSGAWLCTPDGSDYSWAGMVIGSDQFDGYGIFAQSVTDWAANLTPSLTLSVQ